MTVHLNSISRRWRWPVAGVLTACLAAAGPAAAAAVDSPAPAGSGSHSCGPVPHKGQPPPCYSPQAYEAAYGVAPLLRRGIDGKGEIVVMPELANSPAPPGGPEYTDIRQDLAAFDSGWRLPAARLRVVNTFARSATPYLAGFEEVEDTEMVHAIAPGATLVVILVPRSAVSSYAAFAAAVTTVIRDGVALHAAVISISASVGEHFVSSAQADQMNAALEQARQRHVTVIASSGDTGAISDQGPPRQVSLPASDPLVLAVGGTTLNVSLPAGTYRGEKAWNEGGDASGGGFSGLFTRPSYQDSVTGIGSARGVPDVAANANSATGMLLVFSHGVGQAGGTSAATPLWAGVIALADQEAGRPVGFVNPALYAIARGPDYHRAFHDVATGDNSVLWQRKLITGYKAGPGWDPVTGWGSPDAQYLVPLLARSAS